MPLSALFASEQFGRRLGLYGTTWFDEPTEVGALDAARRAAAGMLHAPAEQVAIATSMTEAMSQIAWSLRPPKGTNVVSVDFEFPSVPYPWMRVARETRVPFTFRTADEQGHPAGYLTGKTTLKRLDFGVGQGDWQSTEWVGNDVTVAYSLRLTPATH